MVIVITGATKGIGRAITESMAVEENRLALCARTGKDLEELKRFIISDTTCNHVMIREVNVREKDELMGFTKDILRQYGLVDVLINNAGIYKPGTILDEDEDTFSAVMETNLHSAYFLTKALLPSMISRQKGHVINLCSVASIQGYPNGGSYTISKHALLGFGRTLREEVRRHGIRVTNILPGATWSESWKDVDLPDDRLMSPRNIAQVVLTAIKLDDNTVMEDIVLRPILGDL